MSLSETTGRQRAAVLPVLDSTAGPVAAAYGLRRLSVTYGGAAVAVRRAYDNAIADIGFDFRGDLDIQALAQFLNNSTGSVATWYDQSGNGRDIEQYIYSRQPGIMNSGVVVRKNGLPALSFSALSAQYLTRNDAFMFDAGQTTVIAVVSQPAEVNRWVLAEGYLYNNNPIYCPLQSDATAGDTAARYIRNDFGGLPDLNNNKTGIFTAFNNMLNVVSSVDNGSAFLQYVNGKLSSNNAYTRTGASSFNTFTVGGIVQGVTRLFYNGLLSELIIYPRALVGNDRKAIEQNQKQYLTTP